MTTENKERVFSFYGEENWSGHENPANALQDMFEDGSLEVGNTFLTGIKRPITPWQYFPDATDLLEKYDDCIYDNCGEYAESNTGSDQVSDEAKKELNDLLKSWVEKHLNLNFYEIDDDEEIEVTKEMIEAFHQDKKIPLPQFKPEGKAHD